jgi:hypothetical protein
MDAYYMQIRKLEGKFYGIDYHHVPHDANQAADRLSKLGSSRAEVPARVFVQDLMTTSIQEEQLDDEVPPFEQLVMTIPTPTPDWRSNSSNTSPRLRFQAIGQKWNASFITVSIMC